MKPWEKISFIDYEKHMNSKEVMQLQTLNKIIKKQLNKYDVQSVCIFGITCGNGLKHVDTNKINKIIGIDINNDYLEECRKRYSCLGGLQLLNFDLESANVKLGIESDLIIANLVIEYIGISAFCKHVKDVQPKYVSCVLQHSSENQLVSHSKYASVFDGLADTTFETSNADLILNMKSIGYRTIFTEIIKLPNHKHFERLDFTK